MLIQSKYDLNYKISFLIIRISKGRELIKYAHTHTQINFKKSGSWNLILHAMEASEEFFKIECHVM